MLTEKQLTGDPDLVAFASAYERVGGFPLKAASIREARVMGFFRDGKLVGGYIVNEHGPFRALQDMPEAEATRILNDAPDKSMYELTCVWMEPDVRRTFAGNAMWLYVVRVLVARRDQRAVVSTVNESLRKFYEEFGFTICYAGVIDMADGSALPKYVMTLDSVRPVIMASLRLGPGRYTKGAKLGVQKRLTRLNVRPAVLATAS